MTFRILRQQCRQAQQITSTCTKTRVCYNIIARHYLSTVAKTTKTITNLPQQVLTPLQKHAPTFYARGDDIIPLYEPHAFYSELKVTTKKNIEWDIFFIFLIRK